MSNAIAFIGLGANLGDAQTTLIEAIEALRHTSAIHAVESSSLWRSDPVDAPGPAYINAVAKISTTLAPLPLLQVLNTIEATFGRERHFRNAPRTLDLDLLLYEKLAFSTPTLTVPHPRMHLRAFVIKPLAELGVTDTVVNGQPLTHWFTVCSEQPCSTL